MANLLGADIGTNYKGILSLDSTINTPLDATLRAVTDGEGDASPLLLSTTSVTNLGSGAVASNTAFGDGALTSNTTGTGITAIGYQALRLSTGNSNTAIGFQSSDSTTTGSQNTAIGSQTFESNTTGNNNVAIGYQALKLNVTGSNNMALGTQSLFQNTGNSNTAVGTETMFNNTTGRENVAIGFRAMQNNVSGIKNTAIGYNTQSGNFNGSVILGQDAIATAANQFVVGSTGTNAGSVAAEVNTSANVWNVVINGVARKILLA